MTALTITIEDRALVVEVDGATPVELPVGLDVLRRRELHTDPPRPEELTNAIGAVADHLDDVVRERPDIVGADVSVRGAAVGAIAAVEVGGAATLPFVLSRPAAEDVFRTVATEPAADRRLNPGLDAEMVDVVVAACCALVAVMRRLQLDHVVVER